MCAREIEANPLGMKRLYIIMLHCERETHLTPLHRSPYAGHRQKDMDICMSRVR